MQARIYYDFIYLFITYLFIYLLLLIVQARI